MESLNHTKPSIFEEAFTLESKRPNLLTMRVSSILFAVTGIISLASAVPSQQVEQSDASLSVEAATNTPCFDLFECILV
jgi:hypothetical protein